MGIIYSWLPALIDDTQFQNHNDFVNHLYCIFERDFKDRSNPVVFEQTIVQYASKIVDCSMYVHQGHCGNYQYKCLNCSYKGREDIFNHLTCYENNNKRRPGIFDLQRSIRIEWIKPIIENYQDTNILFWEEPYENRGFTLYFWLKDLDYLVILRRTKNNLLFLTTGFFVDKTSNYARNLTNKYIAFNAKKTP